MKKYLVLFSILLISCITYSQVTITPYPFEVIESITITVDANSNLTDCNKPITHRRTTINNKNNNYYNEKKILLHYQQDDIDTKHVQQEELFASQEASYDNQEEATYDA